MKWTKDDSSVSTSSSYQITNVTEDATYTAVFEVVSTQTPHHKDSNNDSDNDSNNDSNNDNSSNTKEEAYVNPLVWNYAVNQPNSLCLVEKQGAACVAVFKAATPNGYKEAFSFNLLLKDNGSFKPTFVKKTGKFVLHIPKEYQKAGRTFALIGIDRFGNTKIFTDEDLSNETITTTLDIEGYAFSLIYTDGAGSITTSAQEMTNSTYIVQAGDTLSGIAKKLGKTRKELIEKNSLSNPDKLKIGQKILYSMSFS